MPLTDGGVRLQFEGSNFFYHRSDLRKNAGTRNETVLHIVLSIKSIIRDRERKFWRGSGKERRTIYRTQTNTIFSRELVAQVTRSCHAIEDRLTMTVYVT